MQETIAQMSTQMTEKWNGLSKGVKVKMGLGSAALVIALVIAMVAFSKPKMETLLPNLELSQAAEVTQVLDDEKIAYTLADEGRTIKVKEQDINRVKVLLAKENVPRGDFGFADAIANGMATTEDEKRIKMNELSKTRLEEQIASFNNVQEAKVNLVIPEEKNSFLASKQQSTASVLLTLKNSLDSSQVESIARLVSTSVQNLDMKNITIVDSDGNSLYSGQDETASSANKQQELKLAAEKDITNKLNELLKPLYDEVRVSPNLILDFSQFEEVREEYVPQFDDNARGIVDRESSQSASSKNTQAGAEPGAANNGGDAPVYQVGGGGNGESKTSSKEIDYANNKVVSNKVKNLGDIDYKTSSLAVHVFKDKVYKQELIEPTLPANTTWEQFKEQNKEQIPITLDEGILTSVKNGTGIDNVVIYGYERPKFIETEPYQINFKDYLPYVLILLILVVIVAVLFKFKKHDDVVETEPELEVEEMIKIAKEDIHLEEIELKETLETKRQIEKFVDEKPEAVANLLRNWLAEDEWE